ncbi:MAG TPA: hypothetical protein VFC90_06345 [Planctomycetota bacterium]|nr:hypothetical protein [Planctomycetota bacterium]
MVGMKRYWIAAAALVIAVVVWRDASAGNVQSPGLPNYQVFNLDLSLGAGFSFQPNPLTDPDPVFVVVVDDITYSVALNPCNIAGRCLVFDRHFTGPFEAPGYANITDPVPDPVSGPDYEWWNLTGTMSWIIIRWAEARGTYFRADMIDMNGEGGVMPGGRFDATSHSLYGQVLGRTHIRGEDSMVHEDTETLTATIAISPTSESRHYQTPYIVQSGIVRFVGATGAGVSGYVQASAFVKGRIIFGLGNAPLRNSNFSSP